MWPALVGNCERTLLSPLDLSALNHAISCYSFDSLSCHPVSMQSMFCAEMEMVLSQVRSSFINGLCRLRIFFYNCFL